MGKQVAAMGSDLSVEERNLLSVAYKNVIGARRASWRIVSSIEQKEEQKGDTAKLQEIKLYRQKIEGELKQICKDILEEVLEKFLIPAAANSESKVFYHKMGGDYHRYMAEFYTGDQRKDTAEASLKQYKQASEA